MGSSHKQIRNLVNDLAIFQVLSNEIIKRDCNYVELIL